jgi:S1-C subfamily serine protease
MPRVNRLCPTSAIGLANSRRHLVALTALLALISAPMLARAAVPTTSATSADVPADVAELKVMQEQVRRVGKKALSCTVAVRVGAAFGSGVIVSRDGYVLTAAHVIGGPGRTVELRFSDGRLGTGKTLGLNRTADAGLVKIVGDGPWPFVEIGKSSDLKPGQWCLATGHPGGFEQGRGPVLRLGRVLTMRTELLSTDCPLIGGDSGGPLFDLEGRVIAIHSRISDPLTANIHVPADLYRDSWDRLVKSEAWGRLPGTTPFVGVHGDPDTDKARVSEVVRGSPAHRAGIRPGDVILQFGSRTITDFRSLVTAVRARDPGERVVMEVFRDGRTHRLSVVVGARF